MKSIVKMTARCTSATFAFLLPAIASAQSATGDFVLLTEKDGPLGSLAQNQADLPSFLNTLYTLVIGVAVVLAVLQIIRGGIMWMLTDSFTEKNQARHLVTIAVMGLVLVLSPVIVFNIINPCILNLSLTGSTSGSTECAGSLSKLDPITGGPTEDPSNPEGDIGETHEGTYVSYGTFNTEEDARAFIIDTPMCAENSEREEVGDTGIWKVICHKDLSADTYFMCQFDLDDALVDWNGDCVIKAAVDTTQTDSVNQFIAQCQQAGHSAKFDGDPLNSVQISYFDDGCTDEQKREYELRFPGGVPDDSHLACRDDAYTCEFE